MDVDSLISYIRTEEAYYFQIVYIVCDFNTVEHQNHQ